MTKITWLGQAGLLFEKNGESVIVDPYLSDSVKKVEPQNYRRVPVDERFLSLTPDTLVCTHDHLDHVDHETLPHYLSTGRRLSVLAPKKAYDDLRTHYTGHNYILFNRHTTVTLGGFTFHAVRAEHSDETAVGFILDDGERKYYITGDTLYNDDIFPDLPDDLYAVFVPINGVGNNMNAVDAARFTIKTGAKFAVPVHFGMFDTIDPQIFLCPNRVIPTLYEEIVLE